MRVYHPAGPLHGLCSSVTVRTFDQVATSKPIKVGPWFSSRYVTKLCQNHNGVEKEIELRIDDIFRCANEAIPEGEYQVNRETLEAIWSVDDRSIPVPNPIHFAKSPSTSLEDDVFESSFDAAMRQRPFGTSNPLSPVEIKIPTVPKRSIFDLRRHGHLKSLYVVHDLLCAGSVMIKVRVGNRRCYFRMHNTLRGRRAFPIGFVLTEYKIDEYGWLSRQEEMFGIDCQDAQWNVSTDVPWPPKPPDPCFIQFGESKARSTKSGEAVAQD